MILISACLCGVNCKYNGKNNYNEEACKLFKDGKATLICPEQLGGLETPRKPCEIINGRGENVLSGTGKVINNDLVDCTNKFVLGAKEALKIAKNINCSVAILKANSPSCGCNNVYDGSFSGKLVKGRGVTAALFLQNGIKVYDEYEINKIYDITK